MARRIVYFLCVVLSLQLSWNVAATYCMHETDRAVNHLGHHAHNDSPDELSLAIKGKPDPAKKLAAHDGHCSSYAHLALATPDLPDPLAVPDCSERLFPGTVLAPASEYHSPPERPQWNGRA